MVSILQYCCVCSSDHRWVAGQRAGVGLIQRQIGKAVGRGRRGRRQRIGLHQPSKGVGIERGFGLLQQVIGPTVDQLAVRNQSVGTQFARRKRRRNGFTEY